MKSMYPYYRTFLKKKKRQSKLSLLIEVTTRFELVIRELQSLALPLGYVTKNI